VKSISVPFRFTGGRVATTRSNDAIARQKIVDVLTSSPPERMGLPNYGASIYSLLFEPIDALIESDFKTDAITEVQNRVSGVTIHDINIRQDALNESTAEITVYYSLPLSPAKTMTFTIANQLTEESPL
jgi:phage baseplate assembly protein W